MACDDLLGLLDLSDEDEFDDKIIAIPTKPKLTKANSSKAKRKSKSTKSNDKKRKSMLAPQSSSNLKSSSKRPSSSRRAKESDSKSSSSSSKAKKRDSRLDKNKVKDREKEKEKKKSSKRDSKRSSKLAVSFDENDNMNNKRPSSSRNSKSNKSSKDSSRDSIKRPSSSRNSKIDKRDIKELKDRRKSKKIDSELSKSGKSTKDGNKRKSRKSKLETNPTALIQTKSAEKEREREKKRRKEKKDKRRKSNKIDPDSGSSRKSAGSSVGSGSSSGSRSSDDEPPYIDKSSRAKTVKVSSDKVPSRLPKQQTVDANMNRFKNKHVGSSAFGGSGGSTSSSNRNRGSRKLDRAISRKIVQDTSNDASLTDAVKVYEKRKSRKMYETEKKQYEKEMKKRGKLDVDKYERKARKSNEFFDAADRPRSKSPLPQSNNTLKVDNGGNGRQSRRKEYMNDRPRSKSPMMNMESDRPRSMSPMAEYRAKKQKEKEEKEPEMDKETLRRILNNMKRNKWKVGSRLEIFSVSSSMWFPGTIVRITKDYNGEWLLVMYDDKQKALDRYNEHLRPIKDKKEIDLDDDKVRQRAAQFVKKNMKKEKDAWFVGQKCEIYDDQVGWTWCEIKEIFTDGEGEWIKIYYTIYDYSRMSKLYDFDMNQNLAKHKKFNVPMGHKGLRAPLPPDVAPYLKHKYKTLCVRIDQYPQESLDEHLTQRYVQINTISTIYKSKNVESYDKIPLAIQKFIEQENIKLLPLLIVDLENTLFPSKLIKNIKRKNDITDSRQLFKHFDNFIYDGDYKYLKQLQRVMYDTSHAMRKLIGSFKGKICIISENDYSQFNTIINYISESAGGDIWRDIFKKTNKSKADEGLSLYSAKSVYLDEINENTEHKSDDDDDNDNNDDNNRWDEDDIIECKRVVMESFLRQIQMEMEFLRLKSEEYFIPIIFSIGDDQSDIDAIDLAANNVFQSYYRLIKYSMIDNKYCKINTKEYNNFGHVDINNASTENVVKHSLNECVNHEFLDYFTTDKKDKNFYKNNDKFAKQTWHQLFSSSNEYSHQLIKISNKDK